MTTSMSWSFPLLARQVIHAADPPRSNPSWASQGVVTWEQNISRLCDKWCEKKKVLRLMWSRCLKTQRFPQHPWTKWFVQASHCHIHFRNEHRPIQHAAQGSQGGSNGLMIYAGMSHLVYSCLEGSEPRFIGWCYGFFLRRYVFYKGTHLFFWSGWFSPPWDDQTFGGVADLSSLSWQRWGG